MTLSTTSPGDEREADDLLQPLESMSRAGLLQLIAYYQAQDGLLTKAQDEARKLRDELAEVERPLDAQMARLNARVIDLTAQLDAKTPEGFVLAPAYRGYAYLGTGQYVLNNSGDDGEDPELIISIASEEEKAGRTIGDSRDNPPGRMIQPEEMCVRIRFANVAGLDALEKQLRFLREECFPSSSTVQQVGAPAGWKLVPVEPTEAMRAAPSKDRAGFSGQVACEVYQSMLAAAPSPKSEQGDQQ